MLSVLRLRIKRLKDDVLVILLMTAMALGLTSVFGVSFNTYRPEVVVVDEDQSPYSAMLMNELKQNKSYKFAEKGMDEAVRLVEEGKVLVALQVRKGFNEDLEEGHKISLGFIKIKDDTIVLSLQEEVRGIVTKMAGAIRISELTADYVGSSKGLADVQALELSAYKSTMDYWKYKNPMKITSVVYSTDKESGYDSMKHTMIGFTLFFSMYTMVFSIGTILADKQYRTWQRMMISPVSKGAILGGSMAASYLVGAVQMGILILCGRYLLGVDWGSSILGVLMICAAFVFTVTSLGLMISAFVKTQAQLGAMVPVILTSTSMLGGCMWPLDIVNNKILLFLANLTPQKWALQGIESIAAHGAGFEAAVQPTVVLLAMGALFFSTGIKVLKTE
ncbi:MAG: ABC transporter permease [Sedimentibacter sp.]|uniref:ABC transporter permease n=1 Tax=Sedimentibacter sp. TaxID=1960295 RepID=UPI003159548E